MSGKEGGKVEVKKKEGRTRMADGVKETREKSAKRSPPLPSSKVTLRISTVTFMTWE